MRYEIEDQPLWGTLTPEIHIAGGSRSLWMCTQPGCNGEKHYYERVPDLDQDTA